MILERWIIVLWERRTDCDELMAAGGRSTKYRLKHSKQEEYSAANVTAYKQSLILSLYGYKVYLVVVYLGIVQFRAPAPNQGEGQARLTTRAKSWE